MTIYKIGPQEFVRRIKTTFDQEDHRLAFFLGAGCSISSGIPSASSLVTEVWLPKLRDLRAPARTDVLEWAAEEFSDFSPERPSNHYGAVLEALFLNNADDRQREIERLCDGKAPGFGYATLAALMSLPGGHFNVALTTNFDDLLADAFFLFTHSRPLVIPHEALAGFIRSTRIRPLIVKLHGDHRLAPQNTTDETASIKRAIETHVRSLLHDRGLVFIGYGGNDLGIVRMLSSLPTEALPLGVYWVGNSIPNGPIASWLESHHAVQVEHQDFDELMLLMHAAFELPHPDRQALDEIFESYLKTYVRLSDKIAALPEDAQNASAFKAAAEQVDQAFESAQAVQLAASKAEDPQVAKMIFEQGITDFPTDRDLASEYAIFSWQVLDDTERAEEILRGIYERGGRRSVDICNYAGVLLAHGKTKEGLSLLETLSRRQTSRMDMLVEIAFYKYLHGPAADRSENLSLVKAHLEDDDFTGWIMIRNVERAKLDGHPDSGHLDQLASVLSGNVSLANLQRWRKWRDS